MTSSNDDEVTALQRRLHNGKSGPPPQLCMVRAALAMARDTTLTLTAACDQAGVKPGSRARAAQFRDRITDESLLVIGRAPKHPLPLPPPSPTQDSRMEHNWPPPSSHSGPFFFDDLHLTVAECNAVVHARYPTLQAPRCHRCGDKCVLVRLLDADQFHCSERSAWLEPVTFDDWDGAVYWSCALGDCECEFQHGTRPVCPDPCIQRESDCVESATSSHRVSAILCVNSNSRRAKWNGIYFLIDESRDRESLV
jgi:hypothetical protein